MKFGKSHSRLKSRISLLWLFCMYVREKGQQRWIGQLTEKVAERTTAEIAFYIVWHSQADKKKTSIRQRFDMYPESWTHIYKLGGPHGCFSVFYRRHPFCFCLNSFVIVIIYIFFNSFREFFKRRIVLLITIIHLIL